MSQHVAFALPNNLPAPPVEPKLPLAVSSRKEQAVARTTASQQVRRSAGRGFAAALAVGLARRARVRPMVVASSPDETYEELVQGSVALKEEPWQKTFVASMMGGAYVGMACLLSFALGGNLFGSPVAQMTAFAALFPINLLLTLQSGGQLFTGNACTMALGVYEQRVAVKDLLRNWTLAFLGNVVGCVIMGFVANYTKILAGGAGDMVVAAAVRKCSQGFGELLVKGVMCNWLLCLAVWLCTMAKGLGGKLIGAWWPISMFVAIGFEHSVTNMFILPAAMMLGAPLTWTDVLLKNLAPVTVGNAIAGAFLVAASMSFSFGRLGRKGFQPKAQTATPELS